MSFEIHTPTSVHPTKGYSHAVRMGDLLFISGQIAWDAGGALVGEGDIGAQADQAFANLRAILDELGSGLHRIGKLTIYTTKLEHRPAIADARRRAFTNVSHVPASTFVVVSSLADPAWLIEVEAVALTGTG